MKIKKKPSKTEIQKIAVKVYKDLLKRKIITVEIKDKIKRKIKYPKAIKKLNELCSRPHGLRGWSNWEYEIDDIIDEEIKEKK